MIYIYYIIYEGNARVCVLAVRDDELSMGNSNELSVTVRRAEVAKGDDTCT